MCWLRVEAVCLKIWILQGKGAAQQAGIDLGVYRQRKREKAISMPFSLAEAWWQLLHEVLLFGGRVSGEDVVDETLLSRSRGNSGVSFAVLISDIFRLYEFLDR